MKREDSSDKSDLRTPADPAAALEDPKLPALHHGLTGLKDEDIVPDTQIKLEEEEKFAWFITTELKTVSEEDAKLHFQTGEGEIAALYPKVELKTEDESKLSIKADDQEVKVGEGIAGFEPSKSDTDAKMDLDAPNNTKVEGTALSLDVPLPLSCLGEADLPEIGLRIDLVETKTVSLPQHPLPDVREELETNPDVGIESEGHVENTADSISESAQKMDVDHPAIETDKMRESGDKDTSSTMIPYGPRPSVVIKKEPEEVTLSLAPVPPEGRRYSLDGVFVPTLESLGIKRHQPVRGEMPTKLLGKRRRDIDDESSKPKIKQVKKLERSEGLGAGTLQARLNSAGIGTEPYPIDLESDVRDVSVRRDFMRIHYGGNPQSTFPAIAEDWYTKTGHRYFMYPNLIQNPDSPMIPGAPGLFLDAAGRSAQECDVEWTTGTYKVLTRLGTHDFLYMGEYIIRPADSLTKVEWADQTRAMRSRWCTKLAKKDWGRITRTRIGLRRQLGRDPTFEEVDTALKTNQKYLNINADDIAKAFNDGAEQLAVWTMKCVGYDQQFQRDLVRQITGWVPPPTSSSPPKRRTGKSKSKPQITAAKKGVSTRRKKPELKRALTVESEDEG